MTPEQFLDRPLDPLSYYRLLPSDGLRIAPLGTLPSFQALSDRFLSLPAIAAEDILLEQLLLTLFARPEDLDSQPLEAIALAASYGYTELLKGGKTRRLQRMRLQHLNYCCRALIDAGPSGSALDYAESRPEEEGLPLWDWLPLGAGREMLIRSGSNGLYRRRPGIVQRNDVGMASQLDVVGDGLVSIGSIFSNGAYLLDGEALTLVPHALPLVLLFLFEGEMLGLDYSGAIVVPRTGRELAHVGTWQIDRARLIGSRLLMSDWTRPHTLFEYDLARRTSRTVVLPDIILLNDILSLNDHYFAICKQQGRIFKLDRDFVLIDQKLRFGKGPDRLFDPISIRFHGGQIHIVSWVTASIARIAPF
jgi:hypothetical protein